MERKGSRPVWGGATPFRIQLMISAPCPYQKGKVQGQQPISGPLGCYPAGFAARAPLAL